MLSVPGRFRSGRGGRARGGWLVGTLLGAGLMLSACAEEDPAAAVTVVGEVGAPPVVQFEAPLALDSTRAIVLTRGEGPELAEGDPVLLALTSYDGQTGELVDAPTAGHARLLRLTREDLGDTLATRLVGLTEGSRVLLTQPVADEAIEPQDPAALTEKDVGPRDGASQGTQTPDGSDAASAGTDAGSAGTDGGADGTDADSAGDAQRMLVLVVDVLPTRATGEPVELPADLGVEVSELPDGSPELTVGGAEPPEQLRVALARRGDGGAVLPGQDVTLQFTVTEWGTEQVYDSTWLDGGGPQVVAVDTVFPGLREALLDQQVGSRVVALVPAAQAFGEAPLAAVVDVLAVTGGESPVNGG